MPNNTPPGWASSRFDISVPHSARIWNYWLAAKTTTRPTATPGTPYTTAATSARRSPPPKTPTTRPEPNPTTCAARPRSPRSSTACTSSNRGLCPVAGGGPISGLPNATTPRPTAGSHRNGKGHEGNPPGPPLRPSTVAGRRVHRRRAAAYPVAAVALGQAHPRHPKEVIKDDSAGALGAGTECRRGGFRRAAAPPAGRARHVAAPAGQDGQLRRALPVQGENGRKRPSAQMAARIDQALGADGALVACVPAPKSAARPAERREPRSGEGEPGRAEGPGLASLPGYPGRPADAGGISLTLPCAPMRLVIEISGLGENAEMVGAAEELPGGQGALMLVRDRAPEGGKR
jgi:hypothetical protein